MSNNIHALIYVLVIALVIFRVAKPIALLFSAADDFSRRRNIWLALTILEFLSPNFWLFALVAVPLLLWSGRRDTNPVALYLLLLHVVPPIDVDIPVTGINQLFSLNNYRLLSFCVLIPTAWRFRKSKSSVAIRGTRSMDLLLLAFGAMQICLFVPPDLPGHVILHDSLTNALRRAFLFFVDTYVLYFVVSRCCANRRALVEAMAALCLACALMAAVAVIESLRRWLLYTGIAQEWLPDIGGFFYSFYTFRGSSLRAQASAGHPLSLGYLFAIAFGFWLYLGSFMQTARTRLSGYLVWWVGLWAAYSRGPWIGAVSIYVSFTAMRPRAVRRLVKGMCLAVLLIGAGAISPVGDRIISVLPFMGKTVDNETVVYREKLWNRSWELIQEHPFFGDQYVITKMDDLRQGMGIIDLVNTYADIALHFGLVGLALFAGFILVGAFKTYRLAKQLADSDRDLALLGATLVACVLGTLLMIATTSFVFAYEKLFYVLAGFTAAYVHLARQQERA
jgi:O-antigen ligase